MTRKKLTHSTVPVRGASNSPIPLKDPGPAQLQGSGRLRLGQPDLHEVREPWPSLGPDCKQASFRQPEASCARQRIDCRSSKALQATAMSCEKKAPSQTKLEASPPRLHGALKPRKTPQEWARARCSDRQVRAEAQPAGRDPPGPPFLTGDQKGSAWERMQGAIWLLDVVGELFFHSNGH